MFNRTTPLVHFRSADARGGLLDRFFVRMGRKEFGLNERMFNDDFCRIFHHFNRHVHDLFDIDTNDHNLTERLFAGVKTRYSPHGADETIREWTEEIAKALIWEGEAYYHLLGDADSDNVKINSFGPNGVMTFLGVMFQWVPRHVERHWDRDAEEKPREVRFLDRHKVLRFKMPKMLRKILRAQNRTLATIDRYRYGLTNFHPLATHEDPNPTTHFDFSVWRGAQDQVFYRSTRGTGWNGRKYDGAKRSDFFDCHRLIRFRRNQIILRDDILRQLGSELTRLGQKFNSEYAIDIKATERLPNVEQLDELETRLSEENAAFSEVIGFCYKT